MQQIYVEDSSSSALIADDLETNSNLAVISLVANEFREFRGPAISMSYVLAMMISTKTDVWKHFYYLILGLFPKRRVSPLESMDEQSASIF